MTCHLSDMFGWPQCPHSSHWYLAQRMAVESPTGAFDICAACARSAEIAATA